MNHGWHRATFQAAFGGLLLAATAASLSASFSPPAAAATAGRPYLVADLNPGEAFQPGGLSAGVVALKTAGRQAFLVTRTPRFDPQTHSATFDWGLWRLDGSPVGTRLLRLDRSLYDSHPIRLVGGTAGRMLFVAPGGDVGAALWASDGTRGATVRLSPPGLGVPDLQSSPYRAAALGDRLLVPLCEGGLRCRPWITDGTPAGTRRLAALDYPQGHGGWLARLAGRLFFFSGSRLVASDGTPEGTVVLVDVGAASSPGSLVSTGERLFFLRHNAAVGELWVSDGTRAGTRRVRGFAALGAAGQSVPAVSSLVPAAGRIYFGWSWSPTRAVLATSDGTRAGTLPLAAPWPVEATGEGAFTVLGSFGERLLFAAGDGVLWETAGTAGSTRPLAGCAGGCPRLVGSLVARAGGAVLFHGWRPGEGVEPWLSGGSAESTRLLADLCPGVCSSGLDDGFALGQRLFLDVRAGRVGLWLVDLDRSEVRRLHERPVDHRDRLGRRQLILLSPPLSQPPGGGPELLLSDGSVEGTTTVVLPLPASAGSRPTELRAFHDRVLFAACDPAGMGPFVSDGTAAGTLRLGPGVSHCGSGVREMTRWGQAGYYLAGGRLFRTDGTPEGTLELLDTGNGGFDAGYLRVVGERLLVLAGVGGETRAWTSDGTAAGTVPLPIGPLRDLCGPTVAGNQLFFTAQSRDGTSEEFRGGLWRTDGTEAGTVRLLDLGAYSGCGAELAPLGERLYFTAHGALWRTDGTAAGTQRLAPAPPGEPFYEPRHLMAFGGLLYFFASPLQPPQQRSLYRSNGTAAGSVRLAAVGNHALDDTPPELTALGDRLFFRAEDAAHGDELWATDGTAAGTRRVVDLLPGPGSSRPRHLTAAAGRLYFAADDGAHGVELWSSDGTAAGTAMVEDLAPQELSSWPSGFTAAGGLLFFAADDGAHGEELWALPLP